MTDAMEVLFSYAQEHMLNVLLNQERGYATAHLCAGKREEAFRALLDEKAQEQFDNLLDEQNLLTSFYGRAQFHAGFRLALELGR